MFSRTPVLIEALLSTATQPSDWPRMWPKTQSLVHHPYRIFRGHYQRLIGLTVAGLCGRSNGLRKSERDQSQTQYTDCILFMIWEVSRMKWQPVWHLMSNAPWIIYLYDKSPVKKWHVLYFLLGKRNLSSKLLLSNVTNQGGKHHRESSTLNP